MSNESLEFLLTDLQAKSIKLEQKINNLENYLLTNKTVLTFDEAAHYGGWSKSHLYKLTSTGKIPCYKPSGKMIYFNRQELDNWLLKNQSITEEIDNVASTYVTLHKKGGKK